MRLTRLQLVALTMGIGMVSAVRSAEAYPQFQLSLGSDRCTSCHFSPAGGGLINDFGRDEAGSSISRGGDGRFLHGVWTPPPWFVFGLDVRGAAAAKYREGQRDVAAFPMQADVYLRAGGDHISFNMTLGLRGGARDPQPPLIERFASREHYFMYQRDSGFYVRAGRFFPVYGIRSQDHTAFVRRYLGFHTLEEPYGLASGTFGNNWEAHVSAFTARPVEFLGSGVRAHGVATYYERRFWGDTAALAGQARLAVSSSDARVSAGVVAKRWMSNAEVLVLSQIDLQRQSFAHNAGPTRYQLAGYLGATKFVTQGVMVGAALHHWQPDMRLNSLRDAVEINLQYFPAAHFELHLMTRVSGEGSFNRPSLLSFLQLHYYL